MNTAYEIVKEPIKATTSTNTRFPFAQMEVGDAIYIPRTPEAEHLVRYASYQHGKKTNRKFTVSVKHREGFIRVQRIADRTPDEVESVQVEVEPSEVESVQNLSVQNLAGAMAE